MVNPKSLENLKPDNRSQGKQRINLTLKPETINLLRENYGSVSKGIEEMGSKSVPLAKVDRLQKKIKKLEKDVEFFANKCSRLQSEIMKLNEDPYSVHSNLENRVWELDHANGFLEKQNQRLEVDIQKLKTECEQHKTRAEKMTHERDQAWTKANNLQIEMQKLKSDDTHNQIQEQNFPPLSCCKEALLSDHEEYETISSNFCDFIEFKRVQKRNDPQSADLMIVTIFHDKKKDLVDIRKTLDLVSTQMDGEVGEIKKSEELSGYKWMLQFKSFNVCLTKQYMARIKNELTYNQD